MKLMTYEQVADSLQMSVSGVRKMVARRDVKVVDLGHKVKRITENELGKLIERKTR